LGVVPELDVGPLHLALPFDIHVFRAVDEDVVDAAVFEQQFQRSQPQRLIEHLLDQSLPLLAVQQRLFHVAQMLDNHANLAAQGLPLDPADAIQIELVHQLVVDAFLDLFKRLVRDGGQSPGAWRQCRGWIANGIHHLSSGHPSPKVPSFLQERRGRYSNIAYGKRSTGNGTGASARPRPGVGWLGSQAGV